MSGTAHRLVGALPVRGGRVLLARRSPVRTFLAGAWGVFGGHIEAGESAERALRRELDEELGILPLRVRELATIGGELPEPWRMRLYAVTAWRGEPRNRRPQEHAQIRWCPLAEAQQRLAAAHPQFARLLAQAVDRPS